MNTRPKPHVIWTGTGIWSARTTTARDHIRGLAFHHPRPLRPSVLAPIIALSVVLVWSCVLLPLLDYCDTHFGRTFDAVLVVGILSMCAVFLSVHILAFLACNRPGLLLRTRWHTHHQETVVDLSLELDEHTHPRLTWRSRDTPRAVRSTVSTEPPPHHLAHTPALASHGTIPLAHAALEWTQPHPAPSDDAPPCIQLAFRDLDDADAAPLTLALTLGADAVPPPQLDARHAHAITLTPDTTRALTPHLRDLFQALDLAHMPLFAAVHRAQTPE